MATLPSETNAAQVTALILPYLAKGRQPVNHLRRTQGLGYTGIYKHFSSSAQRAEQVQQIGALAQQYGFTVRVRE